MIASWIGLAVCLSANDAPPPQAKVEVKDGRLSLAMDGPGLRLILPVRPPKASILKKGFTTDRRRW